MPEKSEQPAARNEWKPDNGAAGNASAVDRRTYRLPANPGETVETLETVKLGSVQSREVRKAFETPRHLPVAYTKRVPERPVPVIAKASSKDAANIQMLQEQGQRLCLSLFSREQAPIRSLGFTSSIGGEGKSFLALVTARILLVTVLNQLHLSNVTGRILPCMSILAFQQLLV